MRRTPKPKIPIYLAQTQPGFETIAAAEIAQIEGTAIRGTRSISDKNGAVIFAYDGPVEDLLELRTVEDIFVLVLAQDPPGHTYAGLRDLRESVEAVPLDQALQIARSVKPSRGGQGKTRFRVVARQVGRTNYRRVDAQQAVEKAIVARTDRRWQWAEDGALEFWLTMLPDEVLLALRVTDSQMRHRDSEKREHVPASLRPAAAAALVWLSQPADNDVFLDPMCGAGTLLIERAHAGRYAQLLGGDADPAAVEAALKNIGSRYKPIQIEEWDATNLPIDAASITAAAVNLPFGKQIGSSEENRTLYPAFLREMTRVLRPGARLVLLSADANNLDRALGRANGLSRRESYGVQVLGQRARVVVAVRG